MFNQNEYQAIVEYFEAGFTSSEISLELGIELKIIVTYLSKWLCTKNQQST